MTIKPILFSGPMVRALLDGSKTQTRRLFRATTVNSPEQRGFMLRDDMLAKALDQSSGFRRIEGDIWEWSASAFDYQIGDRTFWLAHLPYAPGDLLYVRESWASRLDEDHIKASNLTRTQAFFWADGPGHCCNTGCAGAAGRVRAAMHMPRSLSRLTLEVTDVRVQRLQDISEGDALAEGIYRQDPTPEEIANGECDAEDFVFFAPGTRSPVPPHREDWGPTAAFAFRCLWNSINEKRGFGWDANPWVVAITFKVHMQNVDALVKEQEGASND